MGTAYCALVAARCVLCTATTKRTTVATTTIARATRHSDENSDKRVRSFDVACSSAFYIEVTLRPHSSIKQTDQTTRPRRREGKRGSRRNASNRQHVRAEREGDTCGHGRRATGTSRGASPRKNPHGKEILKLKHVLTRKATRPIHFPRPTRGTCPSKSPCGARLASLSFVAC